MLQNKFNCQYCKIICLELAIKSDNDLMDLCHIKFLLVNQQLRSVILATIFNNEYGDELFNALCKANDIELGLKLMSN